jgi:hypothetical protein
LGHKIDNKTFFGDWKVTVDEGWHEVSVSSTVHEHSVLDEKTLINERLSCNYLGQTRQVCKV